MSGQGVPREIAETIRAVLIRYGAERISVFGSFARGEERPDSDIDIIVRFRNPKSLLELIRIEEELREKTARNVDLLTEKAISPHIREYIHRDEVVILS